MADKIDHDWKVHGISRRASASGVAVLTVIRPSGSIVNIPLYPWDLRVLAIQALQAHDPNEDT